MPSIDVFKDLKSCVQLEDLFYFLEINYLEAEPGDLSNMKTNISMYNMIATCCRRLETGKSM